ncbi:MAG: asparaginase [Methylococcales bacterium]|nr:asparaginase [Methylococcales bacterium]
MKKILVVFTGGTIGSIVSNHSIHTSAEQCYRIIGLFNQPSSSTAKVHFKTIQPFQVLSENLHPSHWQTLIQSIEAEELNAFDGIIVTHGTDTLAFTAAALSLYFNTLKIPLLLVSSNFPLEHSQANGLTNFNCAVSFIDQRCESGVFVPYQNPEEDTLVHLGTRISSCLPLSGDFISVQSNAFLRFSDNSFYQRHSINAGSNHPTKLIADFSSRILLIRPYPGLDYSHYSLNNTDIVLHDLYHSGTNCISQSFGDNYSSTQFVKKCHTLDIPVYMTPAIMTTDIYSSTQALLEAGAKMIWNMSLESSYAKLLLATTNFNNAQEIDCFLEQTIAYEHVI